MTLPSRFFLILAAVLLAACSGPGRFGNDGTGYDSNSAAASDPASPLYFQQAVGDRVLFEVDQSDLSASARQVLDGQAQWLQANPDYDVIIEGHADEQGTREYNLALGARRANSVMEYLVSKGIPASRIETVSYGKERPIALCSEERCYAQNRRAVTVISAGATS